MLPEGDEYVRTIQKSLLVSADNAHGVHPNYAFKTLLAGTAAITAASATSAATCTPPAARPAWGRGVEGQRQADLGNGYYQNPIIAGDHPDPTILKDGANYYLTYSAFYSCPGLVIWHSTDLVNWRPLKAALTKPLGAVWAVDLCKHNGRYIIYIPAAPDGDAWSIYAIWADHIEGPWSDPVDLKIAGCIDPGHVVGEAVVGQADLGMPLTNR